MARPKGDIVFTEIAGKTVESIKYEENPDWQALELAFSDGTLLTFELSSRVEIRASYLKARKGNLKLIRNYGRVSAASAQKS
jgi:hypothetical protein